MINRYISDTRWSDGPKLNGVAPIIVVFDCQHDKDQLWIKISAIMRDMMTEGKEDLANPVTQVGSLAGLK